MSKDKTAGQPRGLDIIPEATHPSRTTKILNRFSVLSLIVVAVALIVFIRWALDETNPLVVNNNPFPARIVDDPTGRTGGVIFLQEDFCKNTDDVGELRMSYVSESREIFLPIAQESSPRGCYSIEIPVIIPLNLLRDEYRIKFRATYKINPIKNDVTINFESQPITVGTGDKE